MGDFTESFFELDLENAATAKQFTEAVEQGWSNRSMIEVEKILRTDSFTMLQVRFHPETIDGWERWERLYKSRGVSHPAFTVRFGNVEGAMYADVPYYVVASGDADTWGDLEDLPLLGVHPLHSVVSVNDSNMKTGAASLVHVDGTPIKPDEAIGRPREGHAKDMLTLRDMGMRGENGALVTFKEADGEGMLTLGNAMSGIVMLQALIKMGYIEFLEGSIPGGEQDALTIRGGAIFSQLTKAATRRTKTKTVTLKNRKGETVVIVQGLKDALALKPSSRKTFTLLDQEATRMSMAGEYRHDGETVCRVVLSVSETARLYGITEESAKKRLRRDFKAIANESLTIEKKGKGGGWVTIPVAGGAFGIRGDRAAFTFSPDVMTYLFNPAAPRVDLPPELFATDDAKHPAAFQIGVKLYTNFNQNYDSEGRDRLKLTTLLNAAREIPTPEELDRGRRSKTDRIMAPLEAAMDHLVEIGALKAWDYCHEKGEPLTDEEYERIELEHEIGNPTPWELAEDLQITWELGRRYPELEAARQASRERRAGEAMQAKARREKEAKASARRIRGKKESAIAKKLAEEELAATGAESGAQTHANE